MSSLVRKKGYWKSYRKIKSNVNEHIRYIYQRNEQDISNNDSVDSHEVHESELRDTRVSNTINEQHDIQHQTDTSTEPEAIINENIYNLVSDMSDTTSVSSDTSHSAFSEVSSESSIEDRFDADHVFLKEELAKWVAKFEIPHSAVRELLCILGRFHDLPKDPRTLLRTKNNYEVRQVSGGSYHHFGLKMMISTLLSNTSPDLFVHANSLSIQINIDGLPLFKSSKPQLWPILCRIADPFMSEPFIVGLFLGDKKPTDPNIFLQEFIDEMHDLEQNLLYIPEVDRNYHVVLSCVICDTPARAFVKGVKGHSGYHGCEKCVQRGMWNGKMTFPEVNAELRTDVAFDEMRDESHHTGPSPFSGLQIGLVSDFPLDYMHLVCLGVVKRLLMLWMRGPLEGSCRLSATNLRQISEKLLSIGKHLPREFLRKGKSLYEIDRWKASEFRQFLLYTGPVILIGTLPRIKYQHFLKLFVGIFCLSSPLLFRAYNEYASDILKIFVHDFAELYGVDQIVYNVHNLVHLARDGNKFGSIDQFSAFVFESFLGKIKRLVRQPNFPLQQVIRRLSESGYQFSAKTKISVFRNAKKPHENGPVERHFRQLSQFMEVHFQEAFYSVKEGDNGIFVGNKVCLIRNILSRDRDSEKYVVYEEFREHSNFFTVPLNSSDLRIFVVSNLAGEFKTAAFQDVCKCTLLPVDDKLVAIPLIHTQLWE